MTSKFCFLPLESLLKPSSHSLRLVTSCLYFLLYFGKGFIIFRVTENFCPTPTSTNISWVLKRINILIVRCKTDRPCHIMLNMHLYISNPRYCCIQVCRHLLPVHTFICCVEKYVCTELQMYTLTRLMFS